MTRTTQNRLPDLTRFQLLVPQDEWPDICQRALEYREDHHDYIQQCKEWLGI